MKIGPIALNLNERKKLATNSHGENLPKPSKTVKNFSISFSLKCEISNV